MINLDWLLAARHVSIDRETNSPSIFSVLSSIRVDGFPVLMSQVAIAGLMRRGKSDRDKGDARLVISHNGKQQHEHKLAYDFQGKTDNHLAITIHGFIIPGPGDTTFELFLKKRLLGSCTLTCEGPSVSIAPGPQSTAAATSDETTQPAKKSGRRKAKRRAKH